MWPEKNKFPVMCMQRGEMPLPQTRPDGMDAGLYFEDRPKS